MPALYIRQMLNEIYLFTSKIKLSKDKSVSSVQLAKEYIETHVDEKIIISDIARQVGISVRYLQKNV